MTCSRMRRHLNPKSHATICPLFLWNQMGWYHTTLIIHDRLQLQLIGRKITQKEMVKCFNWCLSFLCRHGHGGWERGEKESGLLCKFSFQCLQMPRLRTTFLVIEAFFFFHTVGSLEGISSRFWRNSQKPKFNDCSMSILPYALAVWLLTWQQWQVYSTVCNVREASCPNACQTEPLLYKKKKKKKKKTKKRERGNFRYALSYELLRKKYIYICNLYKFNGYFVVKD